MAIIEPSIGPTKFCLISVKFYYNSFIKINKNPIKNIENTLLESHNIPKYQGIIFSYTVLDVSTLFIPLESLIPVSTLIPTLLTLVKRGHRRPQKYPTQANFLMSSDICFKIDNVHYNDIIVILPPYILSKQKNFLQLLEKEVF